MENKKKSFCVLVYSYEAVFMNSKVLNKMSTYIAKSSEFFLWILFL